jgi:hypothetical protein
VEIQILTVALMPDPAPVIGFRATGSRDDVVYHGTWLVSDAHATFQRAHKEIRICTDSATPPERPTVFAVTPQFPIDAPTARMVDTIEGMIGISNEERDVAIVQKSKSA